MNADRVGLSTNRNATAPGSPDDRKQHRAGAGPDLRIGGPEQVPTRDLPRHGLGAKRTYLRFIAAGSQPDEFRHNGSLIKPLAPAGRSFAVDRCVAWILRRPGERVKPPEIVLPDGIAFRAGRAPPAQPAAARPAKAMRLVASVTFRRSNDILP
jgi:hypothetical protein